MKWFLLALNLCLHAAFILGRYIVFRVDGAPPRGVRIIEFSAALSLITSGACWSPFVPLSPYRWISWPWRVRCCQGLYSRGEWRRSVRSASQPRFWMTPG